MRDTSHRTLRFSTASGARATPYPAARERASRGGDLGEHVPYGHEAAERRERLDADGQLPICRSRPYGESDEAATAGAMKLVGY
ncbi:MAG: hypothetical protein U0235_14680 [Polyangiaceae bacterium]